ncbi:MAG: glycosyltransferase [Syntrophobacteraceae bacterium]
MIKLHKGCSQDGEPCQISKMYEHYVSNVRYNSVTSRFRDDPGKMLVSAIMVLKSPTEHERGVIITNYNHYFSVIQKLFDIHGISKKYYVVLEASYSGYCSEDVLCYTLIREPVFVLAPEPRDAIFLNKLNSNLIPVPLGANWWVDYRVFKPIDTGKKEYDIIMVGSWAPLKRHASLFSALKKLRSKNIKLKTCLIGYPMGYTLEDIRSIAKDFGVDDQIEYHEWVTPEEVNYHLNRSKVNVLWSRFEGSNRAIIEGMFAGVPCILRRGITYGHKYDYINAKTGCYADDSDLHHVMLSMVESFDHFRPREWVLENMTCHKAVDILGQTIGEKALGAGEDWNGGLAAKVNSLHGMQYWDVSHYDKFSADYEYLRSKIRAPITYNFA